MIATPQDSALLSLDDVSVSFGGVPALRNVRLTVGRGESLLVTGPSGAGKTTLLGVLADEVAATGGRVVRPEGLRVARVFQDLRLLPDLSVQENLELAFDGRRRGRGSFLAHARELALALGFADRLRSRAGGANAGLAQRAAVARALLAGPDVLLADEPTSALDAENAGRVARLLGLYNRRLGTAVVWASHDGGLAGRLGGRAVRIRGGRVADPGDACFI